MEKVIVVILILLIFYYFWKSQDGDKKVEEEMERIANAPNMTRAAEKSAGETNETLHTKELCVETLRKLNCNVQFNEKDDSYLDFVYQGENFRIRTFPNYGFIEILDVWWKTFNLDDIDEICNVRKAVNNVNIFYPCTLFYPIQEDEKLLVLHTRRICVFIYEIPNIEDYLATILGDFFTTKHAFVNEMAEINQSKVRQ